MEEYGLRKSKTERRQEKKTRRRFKLHSRGLRMVYHYVIGRLKANKKWAVWKEGVTVLLFVGI